MNHFEGWRVFWYAAVAISLSVLSTLLLLGTGEPGVRGVIRITAQLSLLFFSAAFATAPLRSLWKSEVTRWLMRNRRQLGVSFAYSHFLHLGGILALLQISEEFSQSVSWLTILVGSSAYVFIALMTATSFDTTAAWLGPTNWKRLHKFGLFFLWFVFLQQYVRLATMSAAYVVPTGLLIAAAVIRFAAWHRRA